MIVVDASIVLAWFLEGGAYDAALAYAGENGAFVPGNFHSEIAHALVRAERRTRISPTDSTRILAEILELPLTTELPDPHLVLSVAREHGLTGYDATYLSLAMESKFPLATADATLRAAAAKLKLLWTGS